MSERPMADRSTLDDTALEASLRGLANAIDWPAAAPIGAPDVATLVRVRLADRPSRERRPARWAPPWGRPLPRALVLAMVAILAIAAVAAAIGLGLPGIRLILGEGPATPPPSLASSPPGAGGLPGSTLGLGTAVTLEEARDLRPRGLSLPTDPSLGPPDAIYVDRRRGDQVALVWATRPGLPASTDPGVGLVLMVFDGSIDGGYVNKVIGSGTVVAPVRVDGAAGYWIAGAPHFFFYTASDGTLIEDSRRWVGDALLWSSGGTTYRLETSLGQAAAMDLAATLD